MLLTFLLLTPFVGIFTILTGISYESSLLNIRRIKTIALSSPPKPHGFVSLPLQNGFTLFSISIAIPSVSDWLWGICGFIGYSFIGSFNFISPDFLVPDLIGPDDCSELAEPSGIIYQFIPRPSRVTGLLFFNPHCTPFKLAVLTSICLLYKIFAFTFEFISETLSSVKDGWIKYYSGTGSVVLKFKQIKPIAGWIKSKIFTNSSNNDNSDGNSDGNRDGNHNDNYNSCKKKVYYGYFILIFLLLAIFLELRSLHDLLVDVDLDSENNIVIELPLPSWIFRLTYYANEVYYNDIWTPLHNLLIDLERFMYTGFTDVNSSILTNHTVIQAIPNNLGDLLENLGHIMTDIIPILSDIYPDWEDELWD